jgi:hypothetical protein
LEFLMRLLGVWKSENKKRTNQSTNKKNAESEVGLTMLLSFTVIVTIVIVNPVVIIILMY